MSHVRQKLSDKVGYRKIGHQANFTIGKIKDIDILITDTYADEKILTTLEKMGIQIIQVQI